MEWAADILAGMTLWHWVGVGIVLLTLEVAVGTFDLLWVALAAFSTALFALAAPDPYGGWEGQLVWFAAVALLLVALGRTVFRGLRTRASTHPKLNDRMAQLLGRPGEATIAFENGEGHVKIGDTVWPARQVGEGAPLRPGDDIIVSGSEGTILKVRRQG
jgi:inner membrane protein